MPPVLVSAPIVTDTGAEINPYFSLRAEVLQQHEQQSSGSRETILRQPSDNQQVVVFEQADRQRTRRRRDNPRRRSGTQRQIEARPSNKEKSPAGSKLNAGQAQKNRQTNVRVLPIFYDEGTIARDIFEISIRNIDKHLRSNPLA